MDKLRDVLRDFLRDWPHQPGHGLLVGAAACVVFAIVSLPLPDTTASALAAALLSTMATLALTGARPEEGFARWVDRLGTQEGLATRAMLAVGLVVAAKVALLAVLASQSAGGVLVALLGAHAVSRFWALWLADAPPARQALVVASLWCLPALLLMLLAGGLAFVLAALVASALPFLLLRRRPLPAGADHLDGAQQLCELAFCFGAACALRP